MQVVLSEFDEALAAPLTRTDISPEQLALRQSLGLA